MIDLNDPAEFDALMVRIQARRVEQAFQGAGRVVPPGAAAILNGDTEAAIERDTRAFWQWCQSRGVECINVIGIADFEVIVPAGLEQN